MQKKKSVKPFSLWNEVFCGTLTRFVEYLISSIFTGCSWTGNQNHPSKTVLDTEVQKMLYHTTLCRILSNKSQTNSRTSLFTISQSMPNSIFWTTLLSATSFLSLDAGNSLDALCVLIRFFLPFSHELELQTNFIFETTSHIGYSETLCAQDMKPCNSRLSLISTNLKNATQNHTTHQNVLKYTCSHSVKWVGYTGATTCLLIIGIHSAETNLQGYMIDPSAIQFRMTIEETQTEKMKNLKSERVVYQLFKQKGIKVFVCNTKMWSWYKMKQVHFWKVNNTAYLFWARLKHNLKTKNERMTGFLLMWEVFSMV